MHLRTCTHLLELERLCIASKVVERQWSGTVERQWSGTVGALVRALVCAICENCWPSANDTPPPLRGTSHYGRRSSVSRILAI
jgi:hypothetical protein